MTIFGGRIAPSYAVVSDSRCHLAETDDLLEKWSWLELNGVPEPGVGF